MVPDELIIKPRTSILDVSIRFKVRGGFRHVLKALCDFYDMFQSALRFAVVPESFGLSSFGGLFVSIRFKVRGGSRHVTSGRVGAPIKFQSALRFAVVPDGKKTLEVRVGYNRFQSALRFAVVSDR